MIYKEEIAIMQNNFVLIRKSLNLSGREFGDLIGVTRQTISHIEIGKTKLTVTQYLAIMYVLNTEILPKVDDIQREYVEKLLKIKVKI